MCKVADCDFALDINICEKRPFVVDFEGEYAVLVRGLEGGAEDGAVGGFRDGFKVEAVEGGEHGEFKLEGVRWGNGERIQSIERVLGELNVESLDSGVSTDLT